MKTDNYTWANEMIRRNYPNWLGIDDMMDASIREHLVPGGITLDVGCGKRSPLVNYRDDLRLLVGADLVLQDLRENMDITALVAADGTVGLPFPSDIFDLVVSKTVIEHVPNPLSFFREVYRILKPRAVFVCTTSNLKSLPMLVSYLTPLEVHKWVYRRIFGSKLGFDQFPTYYRANTKQAFHQQLTQVGFTKVGFDMASWPQYFAFNKTLFRLFLSIHRLSEQLGLDFFHVHLIGVYRKDIHKRKRSFNDEAG